MYHSGQSLHLNNSSIHLHHSGLHWFLLPCHPVSAVPDHAACSQHHGWILLHQPQYMAPSVQRYHLCLFFHIQYHGWYITLQHRTVCLRYRLYCNPCVHNQPYLHWYTSWSHPWKSRQYHQYPHHWQPSHLSHSHGYSAGYRHWSRHPLLPTGNYYWYSHS